MCGIGGFSLVEGSRVNAKVLANNLLSEMETRGTDASGWAYTTRRGSKGMFKKDIRGSQLSLKGMPKNADAVILHTRAATQGSEHVMSNNHPVTSSEGRIRLTHNGHLSNDWELRSMLDDGDKLAEVDSAVAPAVLEQFGTDGTGLIAGWAAFAWLDDDTANTVHVARLDTSPVVVARLLDGSIVYASTEGILARALQASGLQWIGNYPKTFVELAEGDYYTFTDGQASIGPKLGWFIDYRPTYGFGRSYVSKSATQGGGWVDDYNDWDNYGGGAGSSQFSSNSAWHYEKDEFGIHRGYLIHKNEEGQYGYFDDDAEFIELDEEQVGFDIEGFWHDNVSIAQKAIDSKPANSEAIFYAVDHDGDYQSFVSLSGLVSYISFQNEESATPNDVQWSSSLLTENPDFAWINLVADLGEVEVSASGTALVSWVADPSRIEQFEGELEAGSLRFIAEGVGVLQNVMA